MKTKTEWYSLAETASLLNVTRQRVHQLCDEHALKKRNRSSRFAELNRRDVNKLLAYRKQTKRV